MDKDKIDARQPNMGKSDHCQPDAELIDEMKISRSLDKLFLLEKNTGCLFVAATPIGNLQDISPRLKDTLAQADIIAAEDTRHTIKLLNHLGLQKKMTSYHAHNWKTKSEKILQMLHEGMRVVLVSDAGMPAVSDPGNELVALCAEENIPVTVIPGPCAAITGLAGSGLAGDRFSFEGFLPQQKKEKQSRLAELTEEKRTMVLYEAPHRLKKTILALAGQGLGARKLTIARELTKQYESFVYLTVEQAVRYCEITPPRGEYVLILEGEESYRNRLDLPPDTSAAEETQTLAEQQIRALLGQGLTVKEVAVTVAQTSGLRRNQVYQMVLQISNDCPKQNNS